MGLPRRSSPPLKLPRGGARLASSALKVGQSENTSFFPNGHFSPILGRTPTGAGPNYVEAARCKTKAGKHRGNCLSRGGLTQSREQAAGPAKREKSRPVNQGAGQPGQSFVPTHTSDVAHAYPYFDIHTRHAPCLLLILE